MHIKYLEFIKKDTQLQVFSHKFSRTFFYRKHLGDCFWQTKNKLKNKLFVNILVCFYAFQQPVAFQKQPFEDAP